ncbi:heterokaryon incompatibility protein-domain-containing protein, partial [Halenospora varia]
MSAMQRLQIDQPLANYCHCCETFFRPDIGSESRLWESNLEDLEAAGRKGCTRCKLMALCARTTLGKDQGVSGLSPDTILRQWGIGRDYVCWVATVDSTHQAHHFEIFRLPSEKSAQYPDLAEKPQLRLLPGNTESEATFTMIKAWLHNCEQHHAACTERTMQASSIHKFPKRILDLRNHRITLRENLASRANYACLSHCWGKSEGMLKTTRANIEDFKIGIPNQILPKTFQDTVKACQQLDIDFLWIDSLCIIQDSPEDWTREAASMGDIYENAYLTIAATKAARSSDGLYSVTEGPFLAHFDVEGAVHRSITPPLPHSGVVTAQSDLISSFPLFDRGWAYQERRLSVRIVHFCHQEV